MRLEQGHICNKLVLFFVVFGMLALVSPTAFAAVDLTMDSLSTPATAAGYRSRIRVRFRIKNSGTSSAGQFNVNFYYGDSTSQRNLVSIGQRIVTSLKAKTSTSIITLDLILPNNALFGSRYIHFYVDSTTKVPESNENNNRSHRQLLITGSPNLRVVYLNRFPTASSSGGVIRLFYRIQNSGYSRANNFKIRFYYSTDSIITTSDTYLNKEIRLSTLAAGSYYPSTANGVIDLTLPSGVKVGKRYIGILVDPDNQLNESSEADNYRSASLTIQASSPDVLMSSWSAPSQAIGYRTAFDISFRVKNQGTGSATSFYVGFYYGDMSSATGLLYLGNYYISSLAKGATTKSLVRRVTLPNRVLYGRRYLHYRIDYSNRLNELNEQNNFGYRTLQVTGKPNIQISYLTRTPSTQVKGGELVLNYRIYNAGASRISTPFTTRFYDSIDSTITTSDPYLGKERVISLLYAQSTFSSNVIIRVPSSAPIGTRYVGVITDYNKKVTETNESDNAQSVSYTITTNMPDLSFISWSTTTSARGVGSQITLNFQLKNQGSSDAGSFDVAFYYGDGQATSGLTFLTKATINGLTKGQSSKAQSIKVSLPSNVLTGSRFIHAYLDYTNRVAESSESNNRQYKGITIQGKPDLYTQTLNIVPRTQVKNGYISISYRLFNSGYSRASRGYYLRFYYSSDSKLTTSDRYLGQVYIRAHNGRSYFPSTGYSTVNLRVPSNAVVGRRYIGAFIDITKYINESNENNNLRTTYFSVVKSIPDLVISSFIAPLTTLGHQSKMGLSIRIRNAGASDAKGFHIYYYYSESYSTANLSYVGRAYISGLKKGATSSKIKTVISLPNHVRYGNGYLHYTIDHLRRVDESNELNNRGYRRFTVTGLPNLVIRMSRTPSRQIKGGQIIISYQIYNIGKSRIYSTIYSRFYYSTDSTIRTSDTYLGKTITTTKLYAGGRTSGSITINIPSNATVGTKYIGGIADYSNRVREIKETDNTYAVSFTVVTKQAELELQNLTMPSSVLGFGTKMKISFSVRNKGTANATGFYVYFYYGESSQWRSLQYFARVYVAKLDAGKSTNTLTTEYPIPNNVLAGTRYIHIAVDASNRVPEINETNNRSYKGFTIASKPNLKVSMLSATPTSQVPRGQLTVRYRVENAGYSRTPRRFYIRIYYSDDKTITTSDTYLRSIYVSSLYARSNYPSTSIGATTVTIPSSAKSGTKYIGAIVDYNNQIQESIETDNTRSSAFTVTNSIADLDMAKMSVPTRALGSDSKITMTFQVRNKGTIDAGAFEVAFYYNHSSSTRGQIFLGKSSVSGLKKGITAALKAVVLTLPKSTIAGRRYIQYRIDYLSKVAESSESNNYGYRPITITGLPNLQVAFIGISPTSQLKRGQLKTFYRVSNKGKTRTSGFYLRFYYSKDPTITTSDTYLGQVYISGIDTGKFYPATANGSLFLTVPSSATKGTRYIGAFADYSNRVRESKETDNIKVAAFNVIDKLADLYMSSFNTNSNSVGVGDTITVIYQVSNKGSADAKSFKVSFFYGDTNKTTKLTYLGQQTINGLKVSKSSGLKGFNVKLPATVLAGSRYIHYQIDPNSEVSEIYKTNNQGHRNINITGKPNLKILQLKASPQLQVAGQALTLEYQIANTGKTRATSFYLRFYYSANSAITTSDTLLKEVFVQDVNALSKHPQFSSGSVTVSIPTTAPLGVRYIGFIVDAKKQVNESSEKDNIASAPFTVTTTKPDLLVARLLSVPSTQQTGKSTLTTIWFANRGTKASTSITVHIYMSSDAKITTFDTKLSSFTIPALGIGKIYKSSKNISLPNSLSGGKAYLGVFIDPANKLPESNEQNNTSSIPFTVLTDKDKDGYTSDKDCDDNDKKINPGAKEICDGKDNNCDKKIDTGCRCVNGKTRACYTGTQACTRQSNGTYKCQKPCKSGTQSCKGGQWQSCLGEVTPSTEICDGKDNNCDGKVDENLTRKCYGGAQGTEGKGSCKGGIQSCNSGKWDSCIGEVIPKKEICDGKDNDCDGKIDNQKGKINTLKQSCSRPCGKGVETCASGQWKNCTAPTSCEPTEGLSDAGENPPEAGEPKPETPNDTNCYQSGCPTGEVCQSGKCITDPCDGVSCQSSEFCRQGQCIQTCNCTKCPSGESCIDGSCKKDVCSGKSCPSGETCDSNTGKCITDPCSNVTCGTGRICRGGQCIDNPCSSINCPNGLVCKSGQCVNSNCKEASEETSNESNEPAEPIEAQAEERTPEEFINTAEESPQDQEDGGEEANTDKGNSDKRNADKSQPKDSPKDQGGSTKPEKKIEAISTENGGGQPEANNKTDKGGDVGCGCQSQPSSGSMLLLLLSFFVLFSHRKKRKSI